MYNFKLWKPDSDGCVEWHQGKNIIYFIYFFKKMAAL